LHHIKHHLKYYATKMLLNTGVTPNVMLTINSLHLCFPRHSATFSQLEYQPVWLGLRWGVFTCVRWCVILWSHIASDSPIHSCEIDKWTRPLTFFFLKFPSTFPTADKFPDYSRFAFQSSGRSPCELILTQRHHIHMSEESRLKLVDIANIYTMAKSTNIMARMLPTGHGKGCSTKPIRKHIPKCT